MAKRPKKEGRLDMVHAHIYTLPNLTLHNLVEMCWPVTLKSLVMSTMKLFAIILLSSIFLTSCGAGSSSLPSCSSNDVLEYLKCALGSARVTEETAESLSAYCEEDPSEWLPELDKYVKSSVPGVRIYFQDLIALGKARPEELDNLTLYRTVMSIYILEPSQKGNTGTVGSCIDHFDTMRASGLIKYLSAQED